SFFAEAGSNSLASDASSRGGRSRPHNFIRLRKYDTEKSCRRFKPRTGSNLCLPPPPCPHNRMARVCRPELSRARCFLRGVANPGQRGRQTEHRVMRARGFQENALLPYSKLPVGTDCIFS